MVQRRVHATRTIVPAAELRARAGCLLPLERAGPGGGAECRRALAGPSPSRAAPDRRAAAVRPCGLRAPVLAA
eukprot:350354-Chlamydomonas_euryale.AAC.3